MSEQSNPEPAVGQVWRGRLFYQKHDALWVVMSVGDAGAIVREDRTAGGCGITLADLHNWSYVGVETPAGRVMVRVEGSPPTFDLSTIRARALADPGKPAGTCRWCGKSFDEREDRDRNCGPQAYFCSPVNEADIACADRATLVAEVERLDSALVASEARWAERCQRLAEETERAAGLAAELDRIHEAIAAFIKRMGGTVHGQRNGDEDEVL